MLIDLSLFQNIDFTSRDNLIFLSILLGLAIFILVVFVWTLSQIIKLIKRTITRLLNIDLRPKFDKKNGTEWLHKLKENKEADLTQNSKTFIGGATVSPPINEAKPKGKNENVIKSYNDKSQKDISEGLSKLKSNNIMGGGIESKMPSRTENQQGSNREIKIPVPTHRPSGEAQSGFMEGQNNYGVLPQRSKENATAGSSIFEGGAEISRRKLEHELKKDTKVWQAAKQSGLTLSPLEREKLIKDIPQVYGRNVSKSDLTKTVRNLGKKMIGTSDSKEHAKLRKEIKFFKKIGGIK